jgi:DnaJ-domain-containing protein 1
MALPENLSAKERAELKAKGFQRFELWLPDLRDPVTRLAAQAEADRMAFADEEDSVMDWLDNLQKDVWDEEDGL